jgi:hypothetical protein
MSRVNGLEAVTIQNSHGCDAAGSSMPLFMPATNSMKVAQSFLNADISGLILAGDAPLCQITFSLSVISGGIFCQT